MSAFFSRCKALFFSVHDKALAESMPCKATYHILMLNSWAWAWSGTILIYLQAIEFSILLYFLIHNGNVSRFESFVNPALNKGNIKCCSRPPYTIKLKTVRGRKKKINRLLFKVAKMGSVEFPKGDIGNQRKFIKFQNYILFFRVVGFTYWSITAPSAVSLVWIIDKYIDRMKSSRIAGPALNGIRQFFTFHLKNQ